MMNSNVQEINIPSNSYNLKLEDMDPTNTFVPVDKVINYIYRNLIGLLIKLSTNWRLHYPLQQMRFQGNIKTNL